MSSHPFDDTHRVDRLAGVDLCCEGAQQVVKRLRVLQSIRLEIVLIRGKNPALSKFGCRHHRSRDDERFVKATPPSHV